MLSVLVLDNVELAVDVDEVVADDTVLLDCSDCELIDRLTVMLDELLELTPPVVLLVLNPTVLWLDVTPAEVVDALEDDVFAVLVELCELVLNACVLLVLIAAVDVDDALVVLALDGVLVLNACVLLLVSSIDSTTGASPVG